MATGKFRRDNWPFLNIVEALPEGLQTFLFLLSLFLYIRISSDSAYSPQAFHKRAIDVIPKPSIPWKTPGLRWLRLVLSCTWTKIISDLLPEQSQIGFMICLITWHSGNVWYSSAIQLYPTQKSCRCRMMSFTSPGFSQPASSCKVHVLRNGNPQRPRDHYTGCAVNCDSPTDSQLCLIWWKK